MGVIIFLRPVRFEIAFFRMVRWILEYLRLWPMDPITKTAAMVIGINFISLLVVIIGEIRFTWLIRSKLVDALAAICPCLTSAVTLMKMVYFLVHRKDFAFLLNGLQGHLGADIKDAKKNGMIRKISFLTNTWSLWLCFTAMSTATFYTLVPLVTWTYKRLLGGFDNSSWVGLPISAALPYEDMTQLENKALYAFFFCLLAHIGNVTAFGFSGIDGAFMSFCMYLSVSQQCLQKDFMQAFKEHCVSGQQTKDGDHLYKELSRLVKRQQNIFQMFKLFNGLYKLIILGHFLLAAIVLGIALVNLLLSPGISKIIYVAYVLGVSSQLYTYCYGAEKLDESCINLSEALYFCDWYRCDKKTQKLVLFVMIKSQSGCLLDAPFFSPSIPLFGAILKTACSYITVLKAFL